MKVSKQQIKTIYEWVKEYSSYNDNKKTIYEFSKSKNFDSNKKKKKNNISFSSDKIKYTSQKNYNNDRSSLKGKSVDNLISSSFGEQNPFDNLINLNFRNLNDMNDNIILLPEKRYSYSIRKRLSDVVILNTVYNSNSRINCNSFRQVIDEKTSNLGDIENNKNTETEKKGINEKKIRFVESNDKISISKLKEENLYKKENKGKLNCKHKNNIIFPNDNNHTSSGKIISLKNNNSENNGDLSIKLDNIEENNILKSKNKRCLNDNSNNMNSVSMYSPIINITKILSEKLKFSYSKTPNLLLKNNINLLINSSSNNTKKLNNSNISINKNNLKDSFKGNINKYHNKYNNSYNLGYSNKMMESEKKRKIINKFASTIKDSNYNGSIKDREKNKKSYNEQIMNNYLKTHNKSYGNNNKVLKINNSIKNNDKTKNNIKNFKRKSKLFNQKYFRQISMVFNNNMENCKLEDEENKSNIEDINKFKIDKKLISNNINEINNKIDKIENKINFSNLKDKNNKTEFYAASVFEKGNTKRLKNKTKQKIIVEIDNNFIGDEINKFGINKKNIPFETSIKLENSNKNTKSIPIKKDLGGILKEGVDNKNDKSILNNSNFYNKENLKNEASENRNSKLIIFEKIKEEEKDMLINGLRKESKLYSKNSNYDNSLNSNYMENILNKKKNLDINDNMINCFSYYCLEKMYKIVDKRIIPKFNSEKSFQETNYSYLSKLKEKPKNDDNNHDSINTYKNYLTFNNKFNNTSDEEENKDIVEILNSETNNIMNMISIKEYNNILKVLDENLYHIENPDFNIFNLKKFVGRDNILPVVSSYIFKISDYFGFINRSNFENFIYQISRGYLKENKYHNDLHGADVTQTSFIYLKKGTLKEVSLFKFIY